MNESLYDRRAFVRTLALGTAGLGLLQSFGWMHDPDEGIPLTVLHTNDMHSHIDPFPAQDPKFPGLGGMEKRAALIRRIRKETPNVLLLDAGDVFQGTPYFNFFGGEPEFRLMSEMGYDAATMGNHEFDNGLEGFERMLKFASFPFLCSNYDFSDTLLQGKTEAHKIFEKQGIRIGVFGIGVALEGLVSAANYGATRYLDPVEVAEKKAAFLKQEARCDMVICLSHIGYSYTGNQVSDLKLAAATRHIDLIIGGHTHTFLERATVVKNAAGDPVIINQVGWAGVRLGRIDILFQKRKKRGQKRTEIAYLVKSNEEVC